MRGVTFRRTLLSPVYAILILRKRLAQFIVELRYEPVLDDAVVHELAIRSLRRKLSPNSSPIQSLSAIGHNTEPVSCAT